MNYKSGPKPLNDFVQIGGPGGQIMGTISMIDGNQVAYFDAQGKMVSGKGRFQYKAKTPQGLYMDCEFEIQGQAANGGIYFSDMTIEYRFDGDGPDAKQYVYVHDVKTVGNSFAYAYVDKATNKVKSASTTFTNLDFASGHICLDLAEMGGSTANKRFQIDLNQPQHGQIKPFEAKPDKPSSKVK